MTTSRHSTAFEITFLTVDDFIGLVLDDARLLILQSSMS